MLSGGYLGKILRVNLTTKKVAVEELPEQIARDYMGGAGFGIKYLFDEVPKGIDALSAENKLFFSCGPLTGTSAPCASKMTVVAKSPLTGAVGMAVTGGYFPAELKFAGYDMLIVEGKSEEPVFIHIKNENVSIRSAKKVWGVNTFDTQIILKEELNDQDVRIACIGPAGEKLSRMACIINEKRAAGRKGLGAVMGSKNLKAIVVRGTNEVPIADEAGFKAAKSTMLKAMKESAHLYPAFSKAGTPMVVDVTNAAGIFPIKNFSATGEKDYTDILGVSKNNEAFLGSGHCYKCPVACSQMKLVKKGKYAGALSDPEYESMYCFGGATGVENLDSIIYADQLCDQLGLDTMSTGMTIAFAMELFEKGILTQKDTNGIDLKFGNDEAMISMIKKMAYREEGIGELLADGSRIAASKIGRGSEKYAMQVKGLEFPGYDPRGAKAHGLSYATAYTGADHNRGYSFQEIFGIPIPKAYDRFASKGKGELAMWNQDLRTATTDCPSMCGFLLDMALPAIAAQNTAAMVNGVAKFDYTPEEVIKVGERINNLAKAFNVREGLTRDDDTLPERFFNEVIIDGTSKGQSIPREEFTEMLNEYYEARGWDKDGIPTREKLEALSLENVIPVFLEMKLY